jgi:hypothetical protein
MSIRKFRPLSPDPYINKLKGDTEFARLAHLNSLVDQVNTEITEAIANKNYKEYVSTLRLTTSGFIERVVQDDFNTGGITWSAPSSGVVIGIPTNDVFSITSDYIITLRDEHTFPFSDTRASMQLGNPPNNYDYIAFQTFIPSSTIIGQFDQAGDWQTRTFSIKVYN